MNVRLVADVPDELVRRQVEHSMQRERQLDNTEVGREMPAIDGARGDQQFADLACENVDFLTIQTFDVGRGVDALDYHWRDIRTRPPMPCVAPSTKAASLAARGASRANQTACGQFHGLSIARSGVRHSDESS